MRRRKVLKIITLGLIGASLAHPHFRGKIIEYGKGGFESYKSAMFKLSEKKVLVKEKERL